MASWVTRVSFNGLTWGDVRELVRVADARGIDDGEEVSLSWDPATDQYDGIEIEGR